MVADVKPRNTAPSVESTVKPTTFNAVSRAGLELSMGVREYAVEYQSLSYIAFG